MRFHSNQLSWAIKRPFISLSLKYHFPDFILFSTMLAPIMSCLDEIYCMCKKANTRKGMSVSMAAYLCF